MEKICTSKTCVRFFEAQVLREVLRELAIKIGKESCERCNGTGGEPFGRQQLSVNRMEMVEDVVTHYGNPDANPCDDCFGTGVEL